MPPSDERPFSRWEALGVVLSGLPWSKLPWGKIIPVLVSIGAAVGSNQAIQQRTDAQQNEAVAIVDNVSLGVIAQMQQEIAELQADVDSLKQAR